MNDILSDTGKNYWDSIARNRLDFKAHSLWRSHSDRVNMALLCRWLPAGKARYLLKTDLFDEAVSGGLYPFLKKKAQHIFGMDLSRQLVKTACENKIHLKGTNADIRSIPFKEDSLDLIVSISTLDHFQTKHEIMVSLREIHRVLRKGGGLIITLDNSTNPVIALRSVLPFTLLRSLGLVPYYVGATFDHRSLFRKLEHLGFEVVEVDAVMHCPRVLAVTFSRFFKKHAGIKTQRRFLRALMLFENLSFFPTRFFTGHFVALKAVKSKVDTKSNQSRLNKKGVTE
jgi:SAM-dependent methyltransferase